MAVAHAWQRDIHVNEQDDLPIVLMHGIADSANSNGQQQLVTALKSQFPSKYVIALPVSDGLASMLREMDQQLDELVNIIRADKNLANGCGMCFLCTSSPKHSIGLLNPDCSTP